MFFCFNDIRAFGNRSCNIGYLTGWMAYFGFNDIRAFGIWSFGTSGGFKNFLVQSLNYILQNLTFQ